MNRRGFLKLAGGAGALLGTAGALAAIGKAPPATIEFPCPSANWGRVRHVFYTNFYAPVDPEPYKLWRWSGQAHARFSRLCDAIAPYQLDLFA